MKKNIYLCTNLKTFMQKRNIQPGEARKGTLTMPIDAEQFEFHETIEDTHRRNPKVWCGETLNIAQNTQGKFIVNLKKLELTETTDAEQFGYRIAQDLLTAKQHIGL